MGYYSLHPGCKKLSEYCQHLEEVYIFASQVSVPRLNDYEKLSISAKKIKIIFQRGWEI